jgi:tRNA(Ile)-lysidine synthase
VPSKPRPKKSAGLSKKDQASKVLDADSRASRDRLQTHIYNALHHADCLDKTLLLAFSGGLDSRVLLQLLAAIKSQSNFHLRAMHVHHGLSPNADRWAEFCTAVCLELGVPLQVVHVKVENDSGQGVEATARVARYQALLSDTADYVVLAHHEDDQAETLLLQLLRGAGVKGLAAMGAIDLNRRLLRPLLNVSRAELQAYAERQGLHWIEDESNSDITYDRNYCRQQILPVILQRFPAAKSTLARSAAHMAEAAQLLDELAAMDAELQVCGGRLRISGLADMPEPRARNLLRWWLSANQQRVPSSARLYEILNQLLSAKADARIKLMLGNAAIRRYRDFAYLEHEAPAPVLAMLWQGEAELQLPDGSRLVFERKTGQGLALERLGISRLRISNRLGGERFKPDLARPTRTLKHLLQEAAMPPWLRERLPLIYCEDMLAVVPGVGVACELQARPDEPGLTIGWEPD